MHAEQTLLTDVRRRYRSGVAVLDAETTRLALDTFEVGHHRGTGLFHDQHRLGAGDEFADDRVARDLAGDEQPTRGLCVG